MKLTMKDMDEKELLELKEDIEDAKSKVSELKGTHKHLMNQLKEDWDCTTVEQAQKKVEKMENEISTLSTQIDAGVKELNEKYKV